MHSFILLIHNNSYTKETSQQHWWADLLSNRNRYPGRWGCNIQVTHFFHATTSCFHYCISFPLSVFFFTAIPREIYFYPHSLAIHQPSPHDTSPPCKFLMNWNTVEPLHHHQSISTCHHAPSQFWHHLYFVQQKS